jgi:SAM-dependent methyltransferase
MVETERDAFGHMLYRCLLGENACEIYERDDGSVSVGGGLGEYFAPFETWPAAEQEAMAYVQGRALDIGCGAGRHALYLQSRGHEVIATDASPLAVQVAHERGVRDARVIPVTQLGHELGRFDTILMLGGNFSLVGSFPRARWLLRHFRSMTTADGRILAGTSNPYGADSSVNLAYHQRNQSRGRPVGQVRLRTRFRSYKSPWSNLLLVSPDELRELACDTGWQMSHLLGDPEGRYIAILEKRLAVSL